MIQLFNIPNYTIDTSQYSHFLHGKNVTEFENRFAEYVGAKYACAVNSATNAIFLIFLGKKTVVDVPAMIPPVVLNALITSGNRIRFTDNIGWIGDSYLLHDFGGYNVIDSAQKVAKNQFDTEARPDDLMFFSFYPTKPVGSCDGGMIVSNDKDKIDYLRTLSFNGMSYSENNWDRKIALPGYKFYMNSIQADIAERNLSKLEAKKSKLQLIREYYNDKFELNNTSDHLYTVTTKLQNTEFIAKAKELDISCGIHYPSQAINPVYTPYVAAATDCSKSNFTAERIVSIPFHENLDFADVRKVVDAVNNMSI